MLAWKLTAIAATVKTQILEARLPVIKTVLSVTGRNVVAFGMGVKAMVITSTGFTGHLVIRLTPSEARRT